jgi:hypothetical protein
MIEIMQVSKWVTLRPGECWYAKLPGKTQVSRVIVRELTKVTVLVEVLYEEHGDMSQFGFQLPVQLNRYIADAVGWLEQLDPPPPRPDPDPQPWCTDQEQSPTTAVE